MSLFSFNKKKDFYAPVAGKLVDLKAVNDEVFASGAMGMGFAVEPSDNKIYSPVNGKVSQLFPTKHAIGINCGKMEILIHVGIDTVDLKGAPFETLVKVGEKIDNETVLMTADFERIKAAKKDPITMVLITNSTDVVKNFHLTSKFDEQVNHTTKIAQVSEK
ncbi:MULTISPECIES: PTS sugar transporter subunit IIA [unclassified Companilactobacillus]|jgi:glucose-specific phosphotransferase system IIA component|uniref:PTS sugar transporter subunit IIA n=1 Tax=unclassified Companilactobacillus TaxID=2767904 RepID=UPI002FEEBA70